MADHATRHAHMVREHLLSVSELPDEVLQIDHDQIVVRSYVAGAGEIVRAASGVIDMGHDGRTRIIR